MLFRPHLLLIAVVGCRLATTAEDLAVPAPGAPARILVVTTTVAGGRTTIFSERLDSATASITLQTCDGGFAASCTQAFVRPVEPFYLTDLFQLASSREFAALRAHYPRPAHAVISPDPASTRLEVTVAERLRVITWEKESVLPEVLGRLRCHLSAAEGALISCAR